MGGFAGDRRAPMFLLIEYVGCMVAGDTDRNLPAVVTGRHTCIQAMNLRQVFTCAEEVRRARDGTLA